MITWRPTVCWAETAPLTCHISCRGTPPPVQPRLCQRIQRFHSFAQIQDQASGGQRQPGPSDHRPGSSWQTLSLTIHTHTHSHIRPDSNAAFLPTSHLLSHCQRPHQPLENYIVLSLSLSLPISLFLSLPPRPPSLSLF